MVWGSASEVQWGEDRSMFGEIGGATVRYSDAGEVYFYYLLMELRGGYFKTQSDFLKTKQL